MTEPDAALTAAWRRDCLERERTEYLLTMVAAAVLYPAYAFIDHVFKPPHYQVHTVMRVLGTLAFVAAFLIVRRTRSLTVARAAPAAAMMFVGPMVAWMVLHADLQVTYLTGYTAFYWGCAILSWPLRWSLVVFGWHMASAALVVALLRPTLSHADRLGGGAFLVVVTVLTTIAIHARATAHRRAFEASRALAERNTELEATMAELRQTQSRLVAQEKLSALGRLLAGLSHEINNPVNVIKNNLDPVREHVGELFGALAVARDAVAADLATLRRAWEEHEIEWRMADLDDALAAIETAVRQIQQIHHDLRTYIRGDTPAVESADPGEGLRATIALMSMRLPTGVAIVSTIDALPAIPCQPGQLNQVWMNLLRNALDAVGEAGRIEVTARVVGGHIVVAFADSGPGVDADLRPRLFEPFATTKGPGGGTGLGLATSYQVVARHGGRLGLDDTHVGGARFVVELPIAAPTVGTTSAVGRAA